MTRDEAAEILGGRNIVERAAYLEALEAAAEALEAAAEALEAAAEALCESAALPADAPPPNGPLTLEELRKMDGEPVWIERIGDNCHIDSAWALVNRENCLCRTSDGDLAFFELLGRAWQAYRRRPEEGTT